MTTLGYTQTVGLWLFGVHAVSVENVENVAIVLVQ